MTKRERKERGCRHPLLIHLLCIAAACAAAFFIRALPPSFLRGEEKVRDAWTDEEGLPYLTDMDSYYHVRLVDQDLQVYCLISPSSFSCGNLVPAACKMDGRVILLGRTSGGDQIALAASVSMVAPPAKTVTAVGS